MEKSLKVDWFSFTSRRPLMEILRLFDFLSVPLVPLDKGRNGYHFMYQSPLGVTVSYTPQRSDIHVEMTGKGCDQLGFIALFDLPTKEDKVTRFDIALDCLNRGFTCADIWGLLQRGEFVSVSGDIRQHQGLLHEGGHTIYIGSAKSERMVRIYDKGTEQKTGEDWVRYEIQLQPLGHILIF